LTGIYTLYGFTPGILKFKSSEHLINSELRLLSNRYSGNQHAGQIFHPT